MKGRIKRRRALLGSNSPRDNPAELISGEPGAETISASIFQNRTSPESDSPCLETPPPEGRIMPTGKKKEHNTRNRL